MFKIEETQQGLLEIISEETFVDPTMAEDEMSTDIMDEGWEHEDLDDDGLMIG